MNKHITDYLENLRHELAGCDPATIQDALADAQEHLYSAAEIDAGEPGSPDRSKEIQALLDSYGTPREVAAAYRDTEARVPIPITSFPRKKPHSPLGRFLGVTADIRTWSALLYMLFVLVTSFIYGVWSLVGGALSLCFLILIIGLPLAGLFLLSIRGLALMEGRIVEALLGVRMPRKPMFVRKGLSWSQKFKDLVTDSHTWKALVYLILRFPLGLLTSLGILILLSFSIKFALYPLWYLWLNRPLLSFAEPYFPPPGLIPVFSLVGILVFFLVLHLVRWLGKVHGRFAKYLLVRK
jgi:hypothetical protein